MSEYVLKALRVRIGLTEDDASQDAWIKRNAASILARMTRDAGLPFEPFIAVETFRVDDAVCWPPGEAFPPVRITYLPMSELLSVTDVVDLATVEVLGDGRVLVNGQSLRVPATGMLRIRYQSAFAELPADALAMLADWLAQIWAQQGPGAIVLAGVSKFTVNDVGTVELGGSGSGGFAGGVNDAYTAWLAGLSSRSFGLHPCSTAKLEQVPPP